MGVLHTGYFHAPHPQPLLEGPVSRYGRTVAKHDVSSSITPSAESESKEYEPLIGRIPIRDLSPLQPEDRWPSKAFVGEVVPFGATVFREGHELLGVDLLLVDPDGKQTQHRMRAGAPGTDRWETEAQLTQAGTWKFRVQAWSDDWASWLHNADIKVPLGQDVDLVFREGVVLLNRAGAGKQVRTARQP